MLGCACKREHLKRRSMARLRRDSNSMSVNHSSVDATVRFLAAASERVISSWRLIVARFSSRSFCSSGIIGFFLLGLQNEGVVCEQRQRIGDQFVQQRVAEPERRLFAAGALLLPQDVGDVVSPEGTCGGSFFDGAGTASDPYCRISSSSSVIWRDSARSLSAMSRKKASTRAFEHRPSR